MLAVARLMEKMTLSELHCVMTSGFATVTGALFGAYTSFGIPAGHLIAASVMSAPAAILMSKLLYPETKRSVLRHTNMNTFEAPYVRQVPLFIMITINSNIINITVMLCSVM